MDDVFSGEGVIREEVLPVLLLDIQLLDSLTRKTNSLTLPPTLVPSALNKHQCCWTWEAHSSLNHDSAY